jgi:hypothetical protein
MLISAAGVCRINTAHREIHYLKERRPRALKKKRMSIQGKRKFTGKEAGNLLRKNAHRPARDPKKRKRIESSGLAVVESGCRSGMD